ncbi:MAG: serine/threonine protein kinase [Deltaproteobacteria bacterium]|nr:serine/threonine protein kinase [Deltaproteobacteria bacterium]
MADQKYRVIQRLAAGGMAEVFLGESISVQGFKKQVAIKRVLPHLSQNRKFIEMFLDEARLSARLNHANIVTVFDIGSTDNTFFLVMEYVEGTNLKELIENVRKTGRQFELRHAIFIGMEACRGLNYAHELADENGTPLRIVHRDVSPPNILITKRGEIKITDFGLAKAGIQVEKTEPGVIKGKFGYLAPEVAMGEDADARCDVFSLGIVLWEMMAGRRLFLGETDYQTVKLVRHANIPRLSMLNRNVDEAFEEILYRALARDPKERFQSAREFGDSLTGYLFSKGLKVTAYDIANLVTSYASKRPPSPGAQRQSILNKLIHEEMARFTSIDGESDSDQPNGAGADAGFRAERVSTTFENPADWFASDSDFPQETKKGAEKKAEAKKNPVAEAPGFARPLPPSASAKVRPNPPAVPPPAPPAPGVARPQSSVSTSQKIAPKDSSSLSELEASATLAKGLEKAEVAPKAAKASVLKYVVIVLVLSAIGAVAWLGRFLQ